MEDYFLLFLFADALCIGYLVVLFLASILLH